MSPELRQIARVSFLEVMVDVEEPFGNYVDMQALPATEVFKTYLNGDMLDGRILQMIIEVNRTAQ